MAYVLFICYFNQFVHLVVACRNVGIIVWTAGRTHRDSTSLLIWCRLRDIPNLTPANVCLGGTPKSRVEEVAFLGETILHLRKATVGR